jgi:integrase/recombinase XerD
MAGGIAMIMQIVDDYLSIRRRAGFELQVPEYLLRSFAHFAAERGQSHIMTKTVIDWASDAPSSGQRVHRYNVVIRLACYARLEDSQHEIPPRGLLGQKQKRKPPFIFTQAEVSHLLTAACQLHPVDSIRPHAYSTLFALLVCTGLRISEALNLRLDDITIDGLIVRDTKFKKNRLVPLHQTTRLGLEKYLTSRNDFPTDDQHIFLSNTGKGLVHSAVQWTFVKIIKAIGMDPAPRGWRRPRIHDLRHTFACRTLEAYQKEHADIDRQIVALSTYMGHTNISDTYWYLESTPELMQNISVRCESFWQGEQS